MFYKGNKKGLLNTTNEIEYLSVNLLYKPKKFVSVGIFSLLRQ